MSLPSGGRIRAPLLITTLSMLLNRLASRGAYGEISMAADGSRSLVLSCPASPTALQFVVLWPVFQGASESGFLASGDGLRWTLTRTGRAALRRLKSEGEGEIPRTAASSLPGYTPLARLDAAESPLSWLRHRRDKSGEPLISAMQFDAGERLRSDFTFAGMTPRVTVNWMATGSGSGKSGGGLGIELADNIVAAQQRVRRALVAVGSMSASLLIDVCGHLKGLEEIERSRGWPPRSGKVVLQLALNELARHYGLPGADEAATHVARRLRHWGVSDYRPEIQTQTQE